jgi:hypothetical protein
MTLSIVTGVLMDRTRHAVVLLVVGHEGGGTRGALQEVVGGGPGGDVPEAGVVLGC